MKTYVPSEELKCPEGVSLFVQDYTCASDTLTLSLINSGRFSLGGYLIYARTEPAYQKTAEIDLSRNITSESSKIYPTGVRFGESLNFVNILKSEEEEIDSYDLTGIKTIYSIEITPLRWQVEKGKNRLVICKNVEINEIIECD